MLTDIKMMFNMEDVQEYITWRFSDFLAKHEFQDRFYFFSAIIGHSPKTPERIFELVEVIDDEYIEYQIDWCEGERYIDLSSVYIFEMRQIQELVEGSIDLLEYTRRPLL